MKRILLGIFAGIGTMFAFVLLVAVGMRSGETKSDMPVSEILANLASAADEMIGREVGPNVFVNGATVGEGLRLTYYYRVPVSGIDQFDQQALRKITKQIKREACRDRMMRKAVDGGAEIIYSYRNNRAKQIFTIEIDQNTCARSG